MADDLRSEDGLGGVDGHSRRTRRSEVERPLMDREVPLGHEEQESRVLAPTLHAWLDGELPAATLRKGATARDVEFWSRVNTEAERRRHLRTPAGFEARVMDAIPQTAPQVITPWWRREFVVTPASALVAAAGLVVAASAITALVMVLG